MSPPARPYDARRLALATLAALLVAALVLVVAVLPAEYGIDPTGLGRRLGFAALSDEAPPPASETSNETYAFDARFVLVEDEVWSWSGRVTTRDNQADARVPLDVPNLTRLTAQLTWTDDAPASGPDTLEVSVRGQGRESELARADAGYANATLAWRSVPFPSATPDGGLRLENATDRSSAGEWRVVVRLYATGDASDEGNDFTVRLYAQRWELRTSESAGAADRVVLTLAPRGQLEYKFAMEANATMTYRWNATAVVHSDLHSDLFDDPEDVVETKVADLAEDAGAYVAPRAGRHGWYFRNDQPFPVTITLETRGEYRILGVV